MAAEFIGRGWAFPLRTDATGSIALVSGARELEESIRLILGTALGERPMRPEFGCRIHEFVFAPSDATTAGRLAHEVRASLVRWEPRIDLLDVVVFTADGTVGNLLGETPPQSWGGGSTLYIDIHYQEKGTNDPRNLVFPFYLIPEEG